MKRFKGLILQMMAAIAIVCIYSSCSGDDYVNAIPGNSNALVSVNIEDIGKQLGKDNGKLIESLFHANSIEDCGIDLGSKLYFFETTDGNFGCCAKVNDKDDLNDWLEKLSKQGICNKVSSRREMSYTILNNSWAIGFNNKVLLMTGPILPAQQADAIRFMSKCLKQKEDDGIKSTPMFDKIDEIGSSVAIVAQVDALPDKIAAPFTIGAPKGADASQLLIAASMELGKGECLKISGESFSFNNAVDKALKDNTRKFRKMSGKYIGNIPGNTLCSIFMNVNGKDFVDMMHNSPGLGMLLAGMNTAIDMDNILKSVDGDMAIGIDSYTEENIRISMAAQLKSNDFLKDVDYWKKSCPSGSTIENCGANSFCLRNGSSNFWFGVSGGNEFYGSTDKSIAENILKPSPTPISAEARKVIEGQRFCMALNIAQLTKDNKELSVATDIIKPLFGNISHIIYCIK